MPRLEAIAVERGLVRGEDPAGARVEDEHRQRRGGEQAADGLLLGHRAGPAGGTPCASRATRALAGAGRRSAACSAASCNRAASAPPVAARLSAASAMPTVERQDATGITQERPMIEPQVPTNQPTGQAALDRAPSAPTHETVRMTYRRLRIAGLSAPGGEPASRPTSAGCRWCRADGRSRRSNGCCSCASSSGPAAWAPDRWSGPGTPIPGRTQTRAPFRHAPR